MPNDELAVWEARELQKKLLGFEPVVVVNFPDFLLKPEQSKGEQT